MSERQAEEITSYLSIDPKAGAELQTIREALAESEETLAASRRDHEARVAARP